MKIPAVVLLIASAFLCACKEGSSNKTPLIRDLMNQRYTVRTFSQQKVKDEHLNQILEAGLISPSKTNIFPWKIVALTQTEAGKALKEKLWKELTTCDVYDKDSKKILQFINGIRTAPVNLIMFAEMKAEPLDQYHESEQVTRSEQLFRATRDAMIPATVMMLTAEELGYGTAFTGVVETTREFNEAVGVSGDAKPVVVLSIGIPEPPAKTKIPKEEYPLITHHPEQAHYAAPKIPVYENKKFLGITKSENSGPRKRVPKTELLIRL